MLVDDSPAATLSLQAKCGSHRIGEGLSVRRGSTTLDQAMGKGKIARGRYDEILQLETAVGCSLRLPLVPTLAIALSASVLQGRKHVEDENVFCVVCEHSIKLSCAGCLCPLFQNPSHFGVVRCGSLRTALKANPPSPLEKSICAARWTCRSATLSSLALDRFRT
jgi:hypothetical protein